MKHAFVRRVFAKTLESVRGDHNKIVKAMQLPPPPLLGTRPEKITRPTIASEIFHHIVN